MIAVSLVASLIIGLIFIVSNYGVTGEIILESPSDLLSLEQFNKITVGMKKIDVIALIGVPPGNYVKNGRTPRYAALAAYSLPDVEKSSLYWCDNQGYIVVSLDAQDNVLAMGFGVKVK